MKLADWIKEHTTVPAFAAMIGAPKSSVWAWAAGERTPRKQAMARIVAATNGAVQPTDFYEISLGHLPSPTPKCTKRPRNKSASPEAAA